MAAPSQRLENYSLFPLPTLLFYSALFIPSFTTYPCGLMDIYLIHCGTHTLAFVFGGPVSL